MAMITFKDARAHNLFLDDVRGRWEVSSDDKDEAGAAAFDRLLGAVEREGATYPLTLSLATGDLTRLAQEILGNALAAGEPGMTREHERAAYYLFDGDVFIREAPSGIDTETALSLALEYLDLSGVAEHDETAAQVVRRLEEMLAQVGCEHFDPAVSDGKLTTLCDVIITG